MLTVENSHSPGHCHSCQYAAQASRATVLATHASVSEKTTEVKAPLSAFYCQFCPGITASDSPARDSGGQWRRSTITATRCAILVTMTALWCRELYWPRCRYQEIVIANCGVVPSTSA